jgi:hypothetical protein
MLRQALCKRRIDELFDAMDKLAAAHLSPMTMEEIEPESKAYREVRHMNHKNVRSRHQVFACSCNHRSTSAEPVKSSNASPNASSCSRRKRVMRLKQAVGFQPLILGDDLPDSVAPHQAPAPGGLF